MTDERVPKDWFFGHIDGSRIEGKNKSNGWIVSRMVRNLRGFQLHGGGDIGIGKAGQLP